MTSCVLLNVFHESGCIPQPPQVVETSCPIKGVMCTRKGMHKECNKSVVTQLTRAHIGYIGSVVPLPSRPVALGPKSLLSQYIPCGTHACVTTITYCSHGSDATCHILSTGLL